MEPSMLVRRADPPPAEMARLTVDGRPVMARIGESIAVAVLAAGITPTRRTPVSGAPRAPYCLMGACYDCLMTIDGRPNRQACMTPVADGMRVETQLGRPRLDTGGEG